MTRVFGTGRRRWLTIGAIVLVGVLVLGLLGVEVGYAFTHPLTQGSVASDPQLCGQPVTPTAPTGCIAASPLTPGESFRLVVSVRDRGILPVTLVGLGTAAHRSPVVLDSIELLRDPNAIDASPTASVPFQATGIASGQELNVVVSGHVVACKAAHAGKTVRVKKVSLRYRVLALGHTALVKLASPLKVACGTS